MRIIGGHDFYDTALAYGRDTDVVLVRHKDKSLSMTDCPIKMVDNPRLEVGRRNQHYHW